MLDDRDISPGSKFKDAELIGIPYQITCGRGLAKGYVECQDRKQHLKKDLQLNDVENFIRREIEKELHELQCNSSNTSI